jgi:hypothetical protein
VYSISGNQNTLFPHQQNKQHTSIYSTSPNLIPSIQTNASKPQDDNKYKNQQISSLLSAVLAPSLEKQLTDIQVNNNNNNNNNNNTTSNNRKKTTVPSSPTKTKRGRKLTTKLLEMNSQDGSDTEPMQKKTSRNYVKKTEDLEITVGNHSRNHKLYKSSSDFMSDYLPQHQQQNENKTNSSKHTTNNYSNDTFQAASMYNSSVKSTPDSNDAPPLSRTNSISKLPVFEDVSTPSSRSPSGSMNNTRDG